MGNSTHTALSRRHFLILAGGAAAARIGPAMAYDDEAIAPQPYFAAVVRAIETLAKLGAPLAVQDAQRLAALARLQDRGAVEAAEKILWRYTLTQVALKADGVARTTAGGADRNLIEQGWRVFLVRVSNPLGITDSLHVSPKLGTFASFNASRVMIPDTVNMAPYLAQRWLTCQLYDAAPMGPTLSGFGVEYRVVQLYSRDRGPRSANLNFYIANTEDTVYAAKVKFRRGARLDFDCLPSRDVLLQIHDVDGRGTVASLTIKDHFERLYPLQAMRQAPDMQFQPHIYRADGETVRLPDGQYSVETRRGPEYLRDLQTVTIGEGQSTIAVKLVRWINPAEWGWYSGDTHIHAAGCSHYVTPTEGVSPETMIRHVRGEALSIGDVLTWGPAWYYQKRFFQGRAQSPAATLEHPELQVAASATLKPVATAEDHDSWLRYDVEVSGFPSSHAGHLVLLRLKEQDYPGTQLIDDWPSWNLPILQWARAQGALAGYAHCGLGMVVDSGLLPNYDIPPMDGVGTQEAIIDVTHGVVDFLSGCDTVPVAELNAWYHMLNCGFRLAMLGETDYPCIADDRPGVGRSYVRLDERPLDNAGYESWIKGLQEGRLYCGDGRSHFLDFKVSGRRSGDADVLLNGRESVRIEALVAARLEPEPPADMSAIVNDPVNGWHLEIARIGTTRQVAVELIVNGVAVDKKTLLADGIPRHIKFTTVIAHSSWVALRILPSAHTHPVFVTVKGRPVRASRRSAEWCRQCVDKVWEVKSPLIREGERPAAAAAFDHARKIYESISNECESD